MIEVTPNIKKRFPKAFRAARKSRFRVVWLRDDLVYCARKAKGHGDYLVRFFFVLGIDKTPKVKVWCNTITGNPCEGIKWSSEGCCAHIAAVIERGKQKVSKKHETKEAA